MPRIISWMFKWSLEITGGTIIWFNYQEYQRRQRIVAAWRAACNSTRSLYYLYGIYGQFQDVLLMNKSAEGYTNAVNQFKIKSSKRIRQLCEVNGGVYARMGQIISSMTGILSPQILKSLKPLNSFQQKQTPYQNIKNSLSQSLKKPMKQIFDGFQTKAFSTTIFSQTHKSILLQNYRQSLVKIILPSTKYQLQYDLLFINKILGYLQSKIKEKSPQKLQDFEKYNQTIKQAQKMTLNEVSLENQVVNAEKMQQLMYEPGSSFYVPYYYKKYCDKNVVIRQFVQGASIQNEKELKGINLSSDVAYAIIMSQIQRSMNKYGLIDSKMGPNATLLRKYIKPAKRKSEDEQQSRNDKKGKKIQLMLPQYQVIFLNMNSLQQIPSKTKDNIINFWQNIKKNSKKKKIVPSIQNYYNFLASGKSKYDNYKQSLQDKSYLYEPMLSMYQKFVTQRQEKAQKK